MKKSTFLRLRRINKGLLLLHCGSWIQNLLFELFSKGESFIPMSIEKSEKILAEKYCDAKSSAIRNNKIVSQDVDLQIIIPVYKTERFLRKCIDSVLNQKTQYSFKIAVVNDGSPDRSGEILREYESDDRVIVYTQENKGLSGARNTALEEIFAKYITFIDSDDQLPQGSIEAMLDAAIRYNADIVQGSYENVTMEGKKTSSCICKLNSNATPPEMKGFPWGKVYKSEIFKNICFPEKYWFEDTNGAMLLVPIAKRLVTIPSIVYYYTTTNPGSITNSIYGNPKSIDTFYVTRAMLDDQQKLKDKGIDFYYPVEMMLNQISINWQRTFALGLEYESAIFILTCDLYNKYFSESSLSDSRYLNLYKSLKNKDFNIYRRECAFL